MLLRAGDGFPDLLPPEHHQALLRQPAVRHYRSAQPSVALETESSWCRSGRYFAKHPVLRPSFPVSAMSMNAGFGTGCVLYDHGGVFCK